MRYDEVLELLQVAASYDSRRADRLQASAFFEAAQRAKWSRRGAIEAVHEHYAHSKEFLTPAHITERIRTANRQPPRAVQLALSDGAPATPEQRAKHLAQIRHILESKKKGKQ